MNQTTGITVGGQRADARIALTSPDVDARSLYVHVPFCFHKCHYCDFYSFVDSRDRQAEFVQALEVELKAMSPAAGRLQTIFVGGGTPSLLRPELWRRLLQTLADRFDLSQLAEFTVECNPETVTRELAEVLREGGVTRASVGAQSFDARHLKTLERWHDPANVERSLEFLRDAGIARRSVDLIFGIPGQTLAEWEADLDTALGLLDGEGIEHVSAYALTYEQGTAMTKKLELGRLDAIDEDTEVGMQLLTWSKLAERGFGRYEVSNFARRRGMPAQPRVLATGAVARRRAVRIGTRQRLSMEECPSTHGLDGIRPHLRRLVERRGSGDAKRPARAGGAHHDRAATARRA
ncbi:radical SAM family heme chaperone HemW [Phycisphaerales bacterium ac7]